MVGNAAIELAGNVSVGLVFKCFRVVGGLELVSVGSGRGGSVDFELVRTICVVKLFR